MSLPIAIIAAGPNSNIELTYIKASFHLWNCHYQDILKSMCFCYLEWECLCGSHTAFLIEKVGQDKPVQLSQSQTSFEGRHWLWYLCWNLIFDSKDNKNTNVWVSCPWFRGFIKRLKLVQIQIYNFHRKTWHTKHNMNVHSPEAKKKCIWKNDARWRPNWSKLCF